LSSYDKGGREKETEGKSEKMSREGKLTKRGSREADEGRGGTAEKKEERDSEKKERILERSGLLSRGRLCCCHGTTTLQKLVQNFLAPIEPSFQ